MPDDVSLKEIQAADLRRDVKGNGFTAVVMVVFFIVACLIAGGGDIASLVAGIILGAACGGFFGYKAYEAWTEVKAIEEEIATIKRKEALLAKKEAERKQAQEEMWASGKWVFPVDEFYRMCCEAGASDVDNEFGMQKASLLAASILRKNNIPIRYHKIYLDDEKVKQYFLTGKKHADEKAAKEKAELERRMREPQKAKPADEEWAQIQNTKALINSYGTEKRIGMLRQERNVLSRLVQELSTEIQKKKKQEEEAKKAARELGVMLTQASMESKKSWGLAGGIAEGIAGPAAGFAAASNVMWENAQIEQRNQQIRQAGIARTTDWIMSISKNCSTYDLEKEKEKAEKRIAELDEEMEQIREKVVLTNIELSVLQEHVSAQKAYIRNRESNVLEIGIRVKNSYVPDVPAGVKTVVDGSLTVDIYNGEVHVGTAHALLPLYGLERDRTETLVALCHYYLAGSPNYRVEIKFNELWVMEQ